MLNWIDDGAEPDIVRTFNFRSDQLQEITSIRNVIYKGVLCLLTKQGAQDFGGGGGLSTNLFYESRQDHHHIFPTKALGSLGITDGRSDTLVNKTLISAAINRSIGGRRPSQYVSNLTGKLGDEHFYDIPRSHRIDPQLLRNDDWDAYISTRRESLRELIEYMCGGSVSSFSDSTVVDEVSLHMDLTHQKCSSVPQTMIAVTHRCPPDTSFA